jgi:Kef-type K+ transport system membrane component KefB
MFTAGYEIDFQRVRDRSIELALSGCGISLVLGLALGYVLQFQGRVLDGLVTGLAPTTTVLGTLLPMWHDSGLVDTRFGAYAMATETVGEFGPIIAIALLLGTGQPGRVTLLLIAFALLALGAVLIALCPRGASTEGLVQRHLNTTSQFPVRVAVLIVILLVWVASSLRLDVLLGSFTAGIVVRFGSKGRASTSCAPSPRRSGSGF